MTFFPRREPNLWYLYRIFIFLLGHLHFFFHFFFIFMEYFFMRQTLFRLVAAGRDLRLRGQRWVEGNWGSHDSRRISPVRTEYWLDCRDAWSKRVFKNCTGVPSRGTKEPNCEKPLFHLSPGSPSPLPPHLHPIALPKKKNWKKTKGNKWGSFLSFPRSGRTSLVGAVPFTKSRFPPFSPSIFPVDRLGSAPTLSSLHQPIITTESAFGHWISVVKWLETLIITKQSLNCCSIEVILFVYWLLIQNLDEIDQSRSHDQSNSH